MAETKIFDIAVTQPAVVTAEIDVANTVIPPTAVVGQAIQITIAAINTGNATGDIYIKFVASPNTSSEYVIDTRTLSNVEPGASVAVNESMTPNTAGTFEFGVKVWGQDESEPSWGTAGKAIIGRILNR